MESEIYNGYSVWGHAILQQEDILQPERYAASGTITVGGKLIEASGILGYFDTGKKRNLPGGIGHAPGSTRTVDSRPLLTGVAFAGKQAGTNPR